PRPGRAPPGGGSSGTPPGGAAGRRCARPAARGPSPVPSPCRRSRRRPGPPGPPARRARRPAPCRLNLRRWRRRGRQRAPAGSPATPPSRGTILLVLIDDLGVHHVVVLGHVDLLVGA